MTSPAQLLDRIAKLRTEHALRIERSARQINSLTRATRIAYLVDHADPLAEPMTRSNRRACRVATLVYAAMDRAAADRPAPMAVDVVASTAAPTPIETAPADGVLPTLPRSAEFIAKRAQQRAVREQLERVAIRQEGETFDRLNQGERYALQ